MTEVKRIGRRRTQLLDDLRNRRRYWELKEVADSIPTILNVYFDRIITPVTPNIFSCFTIHQGAVFFFSLLLSLPSSVLEWHHEEGNVSSEYVQSKWLFYVGYYLEVSSSLLYDQELVHYITL